MFAPNGILALLVLAATPSPQTGQVQATGKQTELRLVAHQEDAPSETLPAQYESASEEWGPEAGTAYADDSEQPIGLATFQNNAPFQEEPVPLPPGAPPPPSDPAPADPQDPSPPGELPADEDETPYADPFLEEPPWEDRSEEYYQDGCECAECARRGSGRECAECATCGGECRRSRRSFWGLEFDGWISQGVTINTDSPADRSNFPVTFNDRSNDYQMNQFYLLLTRSVNEGGYHWDVGGRVDLLYGTDSEYTTARGLEVRGDLSRRWNSHRYGLAMPQAYMEVYAPWGNGLTMKLGHFYTILGYETVPATENFFYSKSLAFQYGEPFRHTGFLGSTRLGILNFHAGMTRGWDNWEDNNNDFAFLGGIDLTSRDQGTSVAFAIHVGREQDEPPLNTNLRTVYSLVFQHWLSERLQYVVQYDHGFDEGAAAHGRDADWFGVNHYLYYTINSRWRGGLRYEWFRDEDATRRMDPNVGADYFELSVGLNWMPTDWVTVRPELRWDWADALGGGSLAPGHRDDQILLAFDVIVRL